MSDTYWMQRAADWQYRAETEAKRALEAERGRDAQAEQIRELRERIESLREQALSDYRDCREEGSHAEAARYDTVASTLRVVLDMLALSRTEADG